MTNKVVSDIHDAKSADEKQTNDILSNCDTVSKKWWFDKNLLSLVVIHILQTHFTTNAELLYMINKRWHI